MERVAQPNGGPESRAPARARRPGAIRRALGWLASPRAPWLEAAIVVGYLAFAQTLGEHFPVSPLSMFSQTLSTAGRNGAMDESGVLEPIDHFTDWNCPVQSHLARYARWCFPPSGSDSLTLLDERELQRHASARAVGKRVRLVRRIYEYVGPARSLRTRDCQIAVCTAQRVQ